MIISCWILLRMRNVSDKSCSENQNTHFMFNNVFKKKLCHIWDNVVKCGTVRQAKGDTICVIQCMRFACWITMARHTFVIYNYFFSTATVVMWIHLSVTFIHTLPVLFSYILMKRSRQKPCENWMLDTANWMLSGIMEI